MQPYLPPLFAALLAALSLPAGSGAAAAREPPPPPPPPVGEETGTGGPPAAEEAPPATAIEARWRHRLEAEIPAGERLTLEVPGGTFPALFRPFATATPQGGVLLLHDRWGHPDWPEVIGPLRRALPDHGWSTLAPLLPDPDLPGAREQARARIDAAVAHLVKQNLFNIVLLGHGYGALAGADYIARGGRVNAFVAIGMPLPEREGERLEAVTIPYLDLYGGGDLREVLESAMRRRVAAGRAGNTSFRQDVVPGADHFFTARQGELLYRVGSWLKRYAEGKEVQQRRRRVRYLPAPGTLAGEEVRAYGEGVIETPEVGTDERFFDN